MHKIVNKFMIGVVASLLIGVFAAPVLAEESSASAPTGNIVVQSIPGKTLTQQATDRLHTSWPWYLVRASGLIAAIALVVLILLGIGQVTGYTFAFLEPLTAWASHRAIGIVFGISVLIHMIGLLFDHFVQFSILDLFIPWMSHYRPVTLWGIQLGSLYVALGVIAFYAVALVIITSLLIVDKKPYLWKTLHLFSYLIILLVFVHALYLGTDLAQGVLRWLWIGLAAIISAATLHRLWRAYTI